MSRSGDSWEEALSHAARSSRAVDLFLEARIDATARVSTGGEASLTQTRGAGLAARHAEQADRMAYQSDPTLEDVGRLADMATADVPRYPRTAPGGTQPAWGAVSLEINEIKSYSEELIQSTLRACPDADVAVRAVSFRQEILVAPAGREVRSDTRQGLRLRARCLARGGPAVSAATTEIVFSRRHTDPAEIVAAAGEALAASARHRFDARPAPTGLLPVVLAAGAGGVLIHEIVGHALEADTVLAGGSWLARSEEPVASRHLMVVDDPRRGRAPWKVDDEGVPARATPLIRDGVVAGCLHDRRSAAASQANPTGHGRCSSFREPVRPRMGCTFVAPGELAPSELLDGIERGVYVRRMETGSTDPRAGRAVFRVTDSDLILRGKIDVPLQPHLLYVDGRHALAHMDRIANDLAFDTCVGSCHRDGQPLAISVGAPTIWLGVAGVFT